MKNIEVLSGVGKITAAKLKKTKYNTIETIAKAKAKDLVQNIGVFSKAAKQIIDSAKHFIAESIQEKERMAKLEIKQKEEEIKVIQEHLNDKTSLSEKGKSSIMAAVKGAGDLFKRTIEATVEASAKYIVSGLPERILKEAFKIKKFRQNLVDGIVDRLD